MSRQRKEHYNIAVAGTGYVGLSLAILLAQHNHVTAVDIVEEKVEQINRRQSPIQDKYIEKYLAEKKLDLTATLDGKMAYSTADFIIIAAPTNYDSEKNFFDTSAVEKVIELILMSTREREDKPLIIIKSTVPVGYTKSVRERYRADNIIFSPEFLRESKALYDNLYPSRIIIGQSAADQKARIFAELLQQSAKKENIETLFMGFTEAEAVKLFANTYLALRISYFNELDTYAEIKGLDGGKHVSVLLSEENKRQFFIPRGFAHGFAVLSEEAIFTYKVDNKYTPQAEASILYNDATLGIDWPLTDSQMVLSSKDREGTAFKNAAYFE